MARIRTIKPEFWSHEELSALPESTHMLAGALLNYADDEGYFNANPMLIKAACFPLREPSVKIPESLQSLQTMGYVELGTAPDGKRYGRIVHFLTHQKVSHPAKSKIKEIQILWEPSGKPPEFLQSPPEPLRPELNREQGTGNREENTLVGQLPDVGDPTQSPAKKTNGTHYRPQAVEILQFLNDKTGSKFQPVEVNLTLIVARLKEGATPEQCRAVIARKFREWSNDDRMRKYLRPATLFNREKFAQYQGELGAQVKRHGVVS